MGKSSTDDQLMNLEVLHPNAAGIDIGNAAHYVAVPPDRDTEPMGGLPLHGSHRLRRLVRHRRDGSGDRRRAGRS